MKALRYAHEAQATSQVKGLSLMDNKLTDAAAQPLIELLTRLGRRSRVTGQPFVTIFFGNPYAATFLDGLPGMLLTYDFYDLAEHTAVRALAGEIDLGGTLPVTLGDRFPMGHGLARAARGPH